MRSPPVAETRRFSAGPNVTVSLPPCPCPPVSRLRSIHAKKTGKRESGVGCEETQTLGTPTPGRKRKRKAGDSDEDEDEDEDSDEQGEEDDDDEEEGKKGKKVETCEDEVGQRTAWVNYLILFCFTELVWGIGTYEILSNSANPAFWSSWLAQLRQARPVERRKVFESETITYLTQV